MGESFFEVASAADVSRLLEAGEDVHARDEFGATPGHRAAAFSKTPAVVNALLAGGADIDARDGNGWTPLRRAAVYSATLAVVNALLEAGAEVNARNEDGWTPFDYAKENPALMGTDVYWRLNEARFGRGD